MSIRSGDLYRLVTPRPTGGADDTEKTPPNLPPYSSTCRRSSLVQHFQRLNASQPSLPSASFSSVLPVGVPQGKNVQERRWTPSSSSFSSPSLLQPPNASDSYYRNEGEAVPYYYYENDSNNSNNNRFSNSVKDSRVDHSQWYGGPEETAFPPRSKKIGATTRRRYRSPGHTRASPSLPSMAAAPPAPPPGLVIREVPLRSRPAASVRAPSAVPLPRRKKSGGQSASATRAPSSSLPRKGRGGQVGTPPSAPPPSSVAHAVVETDPMTSGVGRPSKRIRQNSTTRLERSPRPPPRRGHKEPRRSAPPCIPASETTPARDAAPSSTPSSTRSLDMDRRSSVALDPNSASMTPVVVITTTSSAVKRDSNESKEWSDPVIETVSDQHRHTPTNSATPVALSLSLSLSEALRVEAERQAAAAGEEEEEDRTATDVDNTPPPFPLSPVEGEIAPLPPLQEEEGERKEEEEEEGEKEKPMPTATVRPVPTTVSERRGEKRNGTPSRQKHSATATAPPKRLSRMAAAAVANNNNNNSTTTTATNSNNNTNKGKTETSKKETPPPSTRYASPSPRNRSAAPPQRSASKARPPTTNTSNNNNNNNNTPPASTINNNNNNNNINSKSKRKKEPTVEKMLLDPEEIHRQKDQIRREIYAWNDVLRKEKMGEGEDAV